MEAMDASSPLQTLVLGVTGASQQGCITVQTTEGLTTYGIYMVFLYARSIVQVLPASQGQPGSNSSVLN